MSWGRLGGQNMVLLACVLAPEGDPVWPPGATSSFHSVPSGLGAVLGGLALFREPLRGGWLRFGTQGQLRHLPRHRGRPGSPSSCGLHSLPHCGLSRQSLCGSAIVGAPGNRGIRGPGPGPGGAAEGGHRARRAALGWLVQAVFQAQTEPGDLFLQLSDGLVSPCPGEEEGTGALCGSGGQSGSRRGKGGWGADCHVAG